ncbi:MAG: T9SS C-terminal target domain-containing protein [Bacteroidetes bacterium]|nr:MAG: T9SS C-terminal target domain-containing protein [Bacteroidota bacterium]
MRQILTFVSLLLGLCLWSLTPLLAQIPNFSPIPVEFIITTEDGTETSYQYASMSDFGVPLTQTVSGPLVWAYDGMGDSLMCNPGGDDLTGKMVLIRRGDCFFSLKIWHAQELGALGVIIVNHTPNSQGGGLVNMAGADSADLVRIPAIFITWDDGEIIRQRVEAGENVTATFAVRSLTGAMGAYTYHMPMNHVKPLDSLQVSFFNTDLDNPIPSLDLNMVIKGPDGQEVVNETVTTSVDTASFATAYFSTFVPTELGEYEIIYSNSLNSEVLTRKFVVTDYTFAADNNNIVDWIAPSDESFQTNGLVYDFGNFYYTGAEPDIATHMTFSLANPQDLFTGFPDADNFQIRLYDADPDGDGVVPNATTYDELNPNGDAVIVGFAEYILTGEEQPYDMLTVEFIEPAELNPNGIYLLMVQYNGLNAGLGIAPKYAYGGNDPVPGLGECVFTDRLYTGGWSGDWKGVIRLHLDGFTPTSTRDLPALRIDQVQLSPNPAREVLQVELRLDHPVAEAETYLTDFNGKLIRSAKHQVFQNGTFEVAVNDLPAGTYFLKVVTDQGWRTKKFVVAR